MPRTTYNETHEGILRCARTAFLAEGYERASLRGICSEAGITIGAFYRHFPDKQALFAALVEPAVAAFTGVYERACEVNLEAQGAGDLEAMRAANLEADRAIVEIMYEDPTAFKLLARCASGTPYATFVDDLADREVAVTERQYREAEKAGTPMRRLAPDQVRMLARAHYQCVLDPVAQGLSKDEALASAETVATFFWAGWRAAVLGE